LKGAKMHTELLRIKDKIREAERNKDFLKNKLYFLEEKTTSLRASYQNYEDLLEELKFRVLEMELAR
jgi:chromosome segregation ATPase